MSKITVESLEGKWPKSVAILSQDERHVLDNGRGNPELPKNPKEWVMFELMDTEMTEEEQQVACSLWVSRYNSLSTYRMQYRDTFNNYDHYNATWAACGYNNKQSDSSLQLCSAVFGDATGHILDPTDNRPEVIPAAPKRAKKRVTKK